MEVAVVDTVTLPKDELFQMLDLAHEMVTFCAVHMPASRYYGTANAVWVIAHRASGNDTEADKLKAELLAKHEIWLKERQAAAMSASQYEET